MGRRLILAGAIFAAAFLCVAKAPIAHALPPCSPAKCHSAGTWFWNKAAAQYQLLTLGLDLGGRHYEVRNTSCYGIGRNMWGNKGPEFQRFHCSVNLADADGNVYHPYGLTFYVQGHYAWTWAPA